MSPSFQDLPAEVHQRVARWSILKLDILSEKKILCRNFDVYRKLCRTSSKIGVPVVPWISCEALNRAISCHNANLVLQLLQRSFMESAIDNDLRCRLMEFILSIRDEELLKKFMATIPWLLSATESYIKKNRYSQNSCRTTFLYKLFPESQIKNLIKSKVWICHHLKPPERFAQYLDQLKKISKDSAEYRSVLNRFENEARGYLECPDVPVMLLEHEIGDEVSVRKELLETKSTAQRAVFKRYLRYVEFSQDMQAFGWAIFDGDKPTFLELLPKMEGVSFEENFFLTTALIRNHLDLAKLLLTHPNFIRVLCQDDELYLVFMRQSSVEKLQFLQKEFSYEDYCPRALQNYLSRTMNSFHDDLVLKCVLSDPKLKCFPLSRTTPRQTRYCVEFKRGFYNDYENLQMLLASLFLEHEYWCVEDRCRVFLQTIRRCDFTTYYGFYCNVEKNGVKNKTLKNHILVFTKALLKFPSVTKHEKLVIKSLVLMATQYLDLFYGRQEDFKYFGEILKA
jgi:hypothetical protein